MKKQFLLFGLLIILFSTCKKESFNASKQAVIDDDKIQAYIAANHINNLIKDTSGIYYQIITQVDSGAHPLLADTVQVSYTGKLLNGTIFDTEIASSFQLTGVITAWQYMLPRLTAKYIHIKGTPFSRIRFILPSALGYGTVAQTSIPANSVLDFTIDLLGINPFPPTVN